MNHPPVVNPDKTIAVLEDAAPSALGITAPIDIDGDSLTLTVNTVADAAKGEIRLSDGTVVTTQTSLAPDQLASLVFIPLANANGAAGTFSYIVSDNKGGTGSQTITLNIDPVNDAPILQNAIADRTATANSLFSLTIPDNTFSDIDVGDSLTYSATLANNDPLPSWLTFNTNTRTFNGTPTDADRGAINIKVIASDRASATAEDTFILTVQNAANIINGDDTNNNLSGTVNADAIAGFAGDDYLEGLAGDDSLDGGAGNFDRMFGGDGNDTITDPDGVNGAHGGTGNDAIEVTFASSWRSPSNQPRSDGKITGGFGDDNITVTMNNSSFFINMKGDEPTSNQPNDGNDVVTLVGNYANSVVDMGGGNDTFNGGNGSDNVSGQDGEDRLNGNGGNDGLNGGAGNDTILGGNGNDQLAGGNGDDFLTGGLGSDTLNGGFGSDRFVYNTLAERGNLVSGDTIIAFSTSSDTIDLTELMPTLTGYSGNVAGYLQLTQSSSNALLQIDSDGGGNSFVNLATLNNVSAFELLVGTNVLV